MGFGKFIREKRLAVDLSLRKFCKLLNFDPSNWSKIERERMPAPSDLGELKKIAKILKVKQGSDDWHKLVNSAHISRKKIPDSVYSDEEVMNALPIFFRTANGVKPSKEEREKIIDLLKRR